MSEGTPLFRPQSFEARRHAWLGRPTLLPQMSARIVAIFCAVFLGLLAAGVVFGEYTQRVRVTGVLLPSDGLTRLVAPQSGWVTEVAVANGARVERGDLIYRISIDLQSELGDTQSNVVELLRRKADTLAGEIARQDALDAQQRRTLESQSTNLAAEISSADEQIAVLADFVEQTRAFADRHADYVARGISVSREYESRLSAYHAERSQLARLRRERIQLASRKADVDNEIDGMALASQARRAELERQILDIEQQISETEARRMIQLTAPRSGRVTGVLTQAGQTVSAGTPLLTIVPEDAQLQAELLVPSSGIGFVREASPVLLRYEAFPYQKFGQYPGRVKTISRATLQPDEIALLDTAGRQEPDALYRITVTPEAGEVRAYGRSVPLQPGMRVEAHIMVDTRPLYQWILAPIYSLRGALTDGTPDAGDAAGGVEHVSW